MLEEKETFPMIPESNWWKLRDQFRKSLPPVVNPSYLKSLLNLNSDQASRNLIPPLKRLKLIDDQGKPTGRANDWRNDVKYNATCQQIVSEVYPEELRGLMPGPDIDRDECKQWFMDRGALGVKAAYRAASLYILLNTPLDQARKDIGRKQTPTKPRAKSQPGTTKPVSQPIDASALASSSNASQIPLGGGPSVHIDLQIHISSEADADQIDSIFASIAKHLYA